MASLVKIVAILGGVFVVGVLPVAILRDMPFGPSLLQDIPQWNQTL